MKILELRKVVNLADLYHLYKEQLMVNPDEKKARLKISKLNTSLIRYTLPDHGFPLKLKGNLSAVETIEGLKFLEQIPVYQATQLMEAQERVFDKFGDRISSSIRRVYRSELNNMLTWGKSQEWWTQTVDVSPNGRTPTMLIFKKRVKHWHKLKPEEISPKLSQQLDAFSLFMAKEREPHLSEGSCLRYRRELLGALGWMYRVKGVPLDNLSLSGFIPFAAISNMDQAKQAVVLVEEYLEWMRANLGGKNSTLRIALKAFIYVAEYIHYEHQSRL